MPHFLHIDIESRSEANLGDVDKHKYAEHPSTEITLLSYAVDDEAPILIDFTTGAGIPPSFRDYLTNPDYIKLAWNAPFEMVMLHRVLGLPILVDQWNCVMAMAQTLALPASLGMASVVCGLPEDSRKFEHGKTLIRRFCVPRQRGDKWNTPHSHPEDWEAFKEYNIQDVIAEREIFHLILDYVGFTYPQSERHIWRMDQRINNRGLPMDRELIVKANEVYLTYAEHLRRRMRKITGISNPNSVQQLMAWLESNGHRLPNLQKATVAALLERPDVESGIKDVLLMRQETGMASVKKFKAMADRLADDDRIRGSFKYYGARTGRWAGGGVQPQNMTSSSLGGETVEEMQDILATAVRAVKANDWQLLDMLYDRPVDVLASVVRCAIQAPEGKQLVVADLSSIENVVLGWLADCGPILTLYRTGKDAYKDFATRVFNIEYDEVQKSQRKFAKPPVLGCGYGLGGDGLVAYAAAMGVDLSAMYEPQIDRVMACASALGLNMYQVKSAPPGTVNLDLGGKSLTPEHKATAVGHRLVGIYRDSYPEIPAFWNQLKEAVFAAVREKRDVRCGKLVYRYRDPFLFCELPSGRCIAYPKPRVEMISHAKFGKILAFTYEGLNSVTKRWERMDSAKGKLAEQVTQALARDVLVHGIQNAEREGFEVVGHVHDEAITLSDASREGEGQRLINCLTTLPDWARGMPVGATAWTGKRYMKD